MPEPAHNTTSHIYIHTIATWVSCTQRGRSCLYSRYYIPIHWTKDSVAFLKNPVSDQKVSKALGKPCQQAVNDSVLRTLGWGTAGMWTAGKPGRRFPGPSAPGPASLGAARRSQRAAETSGTAARPATTPAGQKPLICETCTVHHTCLGAKVMCSKCEQVGCKSTYHADPVAAIKHRDAD